MFSLYLKAMAIISISIYLVIAAVTLLIYWHSRTMSYWQRKGVYHEKPHWMFGNMQGLGTKKHFIHISTETYEKYKKTMSFIGYYFMIQPTIFVTGLDLVQHILVKDFNNFADRGEFTNEKSDPLSAHLFSLDGQRWRNLRNKLSSTFTSGKMKKMFPIVVDIGSRLQETYAKELEKTDILEVKEFNARFTTDVIGNCAFGIECDSLKDPNAKFREMGAKIFTTRRHPFFLEGLIRTNPKLAERLDFKILTDEVEQFFLKAVDDTIEYREKNKVERNDFMQMLIELKNQKTVDENGKEVPVLNRGQLAAQAFIFFLAGFETSSSTMSFTLYELAKNPDVQETLRQEILKNLADNKGELNYESMNSLPYLEKVVMGEFVDLFF